MPAALPIAMPRLLTGNFPIFAASSASVFASARESPRMTLRPLVWSAPPGGGDVNVPLSVGDVEVHPGDWLVGDVDGIVALSPDEVEAVATRGEEIASAELACFERVLAGERLLDQPYQDGRRLADHVRQ